MASCTAPAWVAAGLPNLASCKTNIRASAPQASFLGLRSSPKLEALGIKSEKSFASQTFIAKSVARTRCDANAGLVISLSTGALLFLGRFVFLPFQRAQVAKAGLPVQNGVTHFEAGDTRAAEATSFLKTNDPAGFTIVDLLAWGSLGHALGFFILAASSNGYDPQF